MLYVYERNYGCVKYEYRFNFFEVFKNILKILDFIWQFVYFSKIKLSLNVFYLYFFVENVLISVW